MHLTLSCKAETSNTPTQCQAWYCSTVSGYFRRSPPCSRRQPGATHRQRVLDYRHGASSGWMHVQQSPFPGPGLLAAGSWAGQGRARLLQAQETPSRDFLTTVWDAVMPKIMLWIQTGSQGASISSRDGSRHASSVHLVVSVFAELYIAQDKQHFTKQTADSIRNL